MAKKKNQKKPKALVDPRVARKKEKSPLWTLFTVCALLGAFVQIACLALSDWRISGKYTVYQIKSKDRGTEVYEPTKYGLYLVRFNGGTITYPWYRFEQQMCQAVDLMAPLLEGVQAINLFDASCDSTCLQHFRTRCAIYRQNTYLGYGTLGVITLVAVATILCCGWYFVLGKSPFFFQLIWGFGSVCSILMLAWYVWTTDYYWKLAQSQSNFPYPSLGIAFYFCAVGVFMVLSAGIFSAAYGWYERKEEFKRKQESIRAKIVELEGEEFDPLGIGPSFPPGPPGVGGSPGFRPLPTGLSYPQPPARRSSSPGATWGPPPPPRPPAGPFVRGLPT